MKTLNSIQVMMKIGKIVSMIIFIFCVIGFCGCVVGIISLAAGVTALKLGNVTLQGILQNEAGLSMGAMYAAMADGAITCAAIAVVSKFAQHYFKRELADGTPFTVGGANELLRLGILAICVPVFAQVAARTVEKILEKTMSTVDFMEIGNVDSISLGLLLVLTALICKYGAELNNKREEAAENEIQNV